MNVPYIKFDEDDKAIFEGEFCFKKSPLLYNPSLYTPYFDITFQFSPECPAELGMIMSTEQVNELIAERLKQDFIKFLQNVKPD